jgi:hypothetical protein
VANDDCTNCDGTGEVHSHNPRCWKCHGTGRKHENVEDIPLGTRVFSSYLDHPGGSLRTGVLRRNSRRKSEPPFRIVDDKGKMIHTVWAGVRVERVKEKS